MDFFELRHCALFAPLKPKRGCSAGAETSCKPVLFILKKKSQKIIGIKHYRLVDAFGVIK